jgi:hypothetical protein
MKRILTAVAILLQSNLFAQQNISLSDSMPAVSEGLKAGYDITAHRKKEVVTKEVSADIDPFYVTNTSSQAKLILHGQMPQYSVGLFHPSWSLQMQQCHRSRLTNKGVALSAKPCIVIDAHWWMKWICFQPFNKNQRILDTGLNRASISANTIMIVPLNERPSVTVIFFPGGSSMGATAINGTNTSYGSQYAEQSSSGFVRVKNFANNSYLNNQNGPLNCSAVDPNWWSAQWEMVPVSGTNYYQIRNRWKNSFISTENSALLSDNGQGINAMWFLEEIGSTHTYSIKNAANNASLVFQNGVLRTTTVFGTQSYAQWIIEQ